MPFISDYAQRKKIQFFIDPIPKEARVLEIGSGSNWLGNYMKANGWKNYVGLDIIPPADIVGDITQWKQLGLQEKSFDYIVAFEVLEHVDFLEGAWHLLKDEGKLLVTTPMPHTDWVLKILEFLKLNQKRTSPHSNLTYVKKVNYFTPIQYINKFELGQWAILGKEK